MDPNEILRRILRRYGILTENFRATQIIESKLQKKIATYADAQDAAIQIGKALNTALKENLPDALTDGRLFRAVAEIVVEHPMKAAGADVADIAAAIQQELNESAGIGMKPIIPEMNQDQIDGIITGICNADSYEAGKNTMFAQVENAMEGYVDDIVRENADFQYKAGLFPTIERKSDGKCCPWCSNLAGSYPYSEVSDRGNDVFRRHKNCHCQILFNPGDGSKRRQNVSSKKWTDDGKADRIELPEVNHVRQTPVYHSIADPMADAFGRGIDSNPEEIDRFREECKAMGVDIVESDHERLNYQPSPILGLPGQMVVSPEASYAAWCHEMDHVYADRDSGWDGAMRIWDKADHIAREERAYGIEIRMAEEAGRDDIADKLRENLETERRRIIESP